MQSIEVNPEWLSLPLREFRAVRLISAYHLLGVDSVRNKDIFQVGYCFWRKIRVSSQDPNVIHVEEPDDGGTGVDQSVVHVIGDQDPVRCGWRH